MAYADQSRRSSLPTVAAVVGVHAAIGLALVSGLAITVIRNPPTVTIVRDYPDDAPPPPPSDPVKRVKPATPDRVTTATRTVAPDRTVTTIDLPPLPPQPLATQEETLRFQPVQTVTPPQPASHARAASAKGDRGAWITSDDYPSAAERAGEEGVVGIRVTIGADGRVASCAVTEPSGHEALDAATCRLYARRARFTPALDDAGQPVSVPFADRIRWRLPR